LFLSYRLAATYCLLWGCYGKHSAVELRIRYVCISHLRTAYFAFSKNSNLRRGFAVAGIIPLKPQKFVSELDVRLRPLTILVTLPETREFWVQKTPQNAYKASSQSHRIRNFISDYRNSSRVSIMAALDQLAKGTTAMMHRVALLQAETSAVHKANRH
jgi:hypothetical protein